MMYNICTKTSTMVLTRSMTLLQEAQKLSTSSASENFTFSDDTFSRRFKMCLNSKCATIDYVKSGNLYNLVHTEVPKEFRGKGVGKILAKKTLDHIIKNKGRCILSCEYLQHYYNSNKDKYKNYVEIPKTR